MLHALTDKEKFFACTANMPCVLSMSCLVLGQWFFIRITHVLKAYSLLHCKFIHKPYPSHSYWLFQLSTGCLWCKGRPHNGILLRRQRCFGRVWH